MGISFQGTSTATFDVVCVNADRLPGNVVSLTITVTKRLPTQMAPAGFNTGVCVRGPSAAACPTLFEQALLDFQELSAADQAYLRDESKSIRVSEKGYLFLCLVYLACTIYSLKTSR